MGLEIFEDYEEGTECTDCFGEANVPLFGPGNLITPKYVQANAFGIITCPLNWEDANRTWLLTQLGACNWRFLDADWSVNYAAYQFFDPDYYATMFIRNLNDGDLYFSSLIDICGSVFANSQQLGDCGPGKGGYDGSVVVTWGPGISP